MSRDELIFRITDIEKRARERYDVAIVSGDRPRAQTLGRWLVKLNKIGDRIVSGSIGKTS